MASPKKPPDWYKRFNSVKEPHVVTFHSDFAGVKAGKTISYIVTC